MSAEKRLAWNCVCGRTVRVPVSAFPFVCVCGRLATIAAGMAAPAPASARPRQPGRLPDCAHLGDLVRKQKCETCSGTTFVKVFACNIHGECALGKQLSGLACCRGCGDYRARSEADAAPAEGP
jgi:hypothetical protein